jgi:hypothetical protein
MAASPMVQRKPLRVSRVQVRLPLTLTAPPVLAPATDVATHVVVGFHVENIRAIVSRDFPPQIIDRLDKRDWNSTLI